MRAGHAFSVSLELMHQEFSEPLGGEFRRTFEEQNLGLAVEITLEKLATRMPLMDVQFFVAAVILQKRIGGNLAESLEKLTVLIRERFKLRGQIRTISAHGRLSSLVLTAIPSVVALMMYFVNRDHMQFFVDEYAGQWMAGLAIGFQGLGYFIIRQIGTLMVLTLSILVFVMVTGLLYFFGMKFWVTPRSAVDRIMESGVPMDQQVAHPSLAIHDLLEKLGNVIPAPPTDMTAARQKLFAAGYRSNNALRIFYGVKSVSALALPALIWLLITQTGVATENQLFLILASGGLGWLGPNETLKLLISRRKKRIMRALPNSLDLLIVCVESGLGLDQAIIQVSREMAQSYPELSSEFAITNLEMRHGKPRAEAIKQLGERAGVDDMRKLCSTLVQADRFGTSIAQTLRTHADFMRLMARQRAEEKAAMLAIKLVFPIFFCILPSLFVVTVGPVIYRIMHVLIPMMENA